MGMRRHDCPDPDSTLRMTLDRRTVDELKRLVALLPGVKLKAPRKLELIRALERALLGGEIVGFWAQLNPLDQSAVAEVIHSDDGTFDRGAFHAKYGALPVIEIKEENRWYKTPTLLGLFLHPTMWGGRSVPHDLREKLLAFVPQPVASTLSTSEEITATTTPTCNGG